MQKKSGFTLIELLVVIAIIGLLASIVLVSLNSARGKAREARRKGDLKQIANVLEMYASDNNGSYPGTTVSYWWIDDNNFAGTSGYPPCATSGGLAPYFSNVCKIFGPNGEGGVDGYAYTLNSDGSYKLGARFERSENQGTAFTYNGGTVVNGVYEIK